MIDTDWVDPTRLDAHREHSCAGKRRLGEKEARRVARILRDRGEPAAAYACEFCRSRWHVGRTWEIT